MPPIPGRPSIAIKTAFAPGTGSGMVYTAGRHKAKQPELVMRNVPLTHKAAVAEFLDLLADTAVASGETRRLDRMAFVVSMPSAEKTAQLLRDHMQACSKRASVLELRQAVPKNVFKADHDASVDELARTFMKRPCVDCEAGCGCGVKAMYKTLDGVDTFTGIVATSSGFKKLHADENDLDAEGHHMSAEEFNLDLSVYDNPFAPVAGLDVVGAYARRETAPPEAWALLHDVLSSFQDEELKVVAAPGEVRCGDAAFVYDTSDSCCPNKLCKNRIHCLEVLAVHSGGRGIVVCSEKIAFPYRIELAHVLYSGPGGFW